MKKMIVLGVTLCIMTFHLTGCTSAKVEKEPVVIGDMEATESDQLSNETNDTSNDNADDDNASSTEDATSAETLNDETSKDTSSKDNSSKDNSLKDDTTKNDTSKDNSTIDNVQTESEDSFKSTIMLEGMEEEVTYKTYKSELGYQIAYDVDRFTLSSEDEKDTFMAENSNPEIYPYVYFTIGRNEYTGDEIDFYDSDLHLRDDETGKDLVANAKEDTVKIGEYEAIHWQLIDGKEWNSLVKNYYYIRGEKYYYWLQTNYFLEASEGFGTRISAMLDTLVIE